MILLIYYIDINGWRKFSKIETSRYIIYYFNKNIYLLNDIQSARLLAYFDLTILYI